MRRLLLVFPCLTLLAPSAFADAPPPPEDAHLAFGVACPGARGEPLHVLVTATPKGPKVTLTRPGADPGPFETLDVNFAHVSRRLFFKARTREGLIEFQGHARADALVGLYSDDHGRTRPISLPRSTEPPNPCP